MKKYLYLLVGILFFPLSVAAQNLTQAEPLFQKGDFAAAKKEYEQVLKSATGADLWQAQLRYAACQYAEGEYLNAATAMLSYPLPGDDLWKARFLLYRITTAQQTSNLYLPLLNKTEIDDESSQKDPSTWTDKQWNRQIDQDFHQLWALRANLINAPVAAENLILNLENTDQQRIPTLFDVVVDRWLSYLNNHSSSVTKLEEKEPIFLNGTVRLLEGTQKDKDILRAQILETAYLLEGTNRNDARTFWKTDFITLPFDRTHAFKFEDKNQAVQNASEQLAVLSGQHEPQRSWWQKLKGYLQQEKNNTYGRTYAAWKNASLLYERQKYPQALVVCQYAATLSSSHFTQQCAQLAERITALSLSLNSVEQPLNREHPVVSFSGKNLKQVYLRLYRTSFEELNNWYEMPRWQKNIREWNDLFELNEKAIQALLSRQPFHTQTENVPFKEVAKEQKGSFALPALDEGLFAALVSYNEDFNANKSPVYGVLLNASDLALFTIAAIEGNPADYTVTRSTTPHTENPNLFHVYTVNLKTGQPAPHAKLDFITSYEGNRVSGQTDANGQYTLKRSINLVNQYTDNSYQLDTLAQFHKSLAYSSRPLHFSLSYMEPVRLFIQTDRAIYRPNQQVQLSVNLFERLVLGFKTLGGKKVTVTVEDPNYKTIFTNTLTANELGTAATQFTLPQETLLGNYHISCRVTENNYTYQNSFTFKVEEYKRPDYEVTFNPINKTIEFDKPVTIVGSARYYMGTPLVNAKVQYTISHLKYIPPFYWWRWFSGDSVIAKEEGSATTDEKGNFSILLTPKRNKEDEDFGKYEIKAEVFDESGRPISTKTSFVVSAQPHLFRVELAQGFYDANKSVPLGTLDLTNANGQSVSGKITAKIMQLENNPSTPPEEKVTSASDEEVFFLEDNTSPLEKFYQHAKAIKTVSIQTLSYKKPGTQTLQLPALPEGVYRLELTSEKATPQTFVFVVASDTPALNLPEISMVQHSTYHPGETMRILLGAHQLQGSKQVAVFQENGKFLLHKTTLPGGVSIFTFPVMQTMRGGLSVRWFGASDYRFFDGGTSVEIPFDNKKLSVSLQTPSSVEPGTAVRWKLTAKDANNKPVNGQVSATVYDASLDYYAKLKRDLSLQALYPQRLSSPFWDNSHSTISSRSYSKVPYKKYDNSYPPLGLPTINLNRAFRAYGLKGSRMFGAAAPQMALAKNATLGVADDAMLEESAFDMKARASLSATRGGIETEEETDTSTVRTDFAETAYFNPQIPLTNGQATLAFTFPQALTTWNVLGFVLTKQAEFGDYTAQLVTRKDFMLRMQLPRFYREVDSGTLQAAVTNQTPQKLTAQVTVTVRNGKQVANADFGIDQPTQTVVVPANSTRFVTWKVTAPSTPALYDITMVARSGSRSDGEQKELPVLPGKMRLLASTHKALKSGVNALQLTELANVSAKDVELLTLTLNPSLALSVLNDMPNLLSCPHNDLVSTLNRYVPLAVVNQFYTQYPQLKAAVAKLPKRTGLTATWNETNPLRLQLLEQTPWLRQAQGRQVHQANIIDLFNDEIVQKHLTASVKRLEQFQNANGSFSWFPGGPDDAYLTLYALDAFSQVVRYKAPVDQARVERALSFIVPHIEKTLKQDKEGSAATVSLALYAAYTLSSFPAEWKAVSRAKQNIKNWVDYAAEHAPALTPLGKIYAAAVYHRLGDDVNANRYLDIVLSSMKEDPLTGAYFAPEAQSWLWYNDTLTTQNITLRTLLEIRPQSDKIDALTQWLLFNRQVNNWTNTKAAAQTIFTLLDVMQAKGALSAPATYQVNWAGTQQTLTFEPTDFTEDLQWVRTNAKVTPQAYQASITKTGKITDFASLNAVYRAGTVQASPKGVINVTRRYFVREKQGNETKLKPVENIETLRVADEVEVHLTLDTDSAFEYVLVQDPKPAGFESESLLSRWEWNPVSFYREERDANTNFFINWVPRGTMTLRYILRPTVEGQLHALPAQAQSMYAPEYGAHSASTTFRIEK